MRLANRHLQTSQNMPVATSPRRKVQARRGFTLLEASLALVIVGVGITALIEAHTVLSRANEWSTQSATATYLAQEIRERMRPLPRHDPVTGLFIDSNNALRGWGRDAGETTIADLDDIDDFDGLRFGAAGTFPGPIDAQGNIIGAINDRGQIITVNGAVQPMAGWAQSVTVEKVDPNNFSTVRAPSYARAAQGSIPALRVDQFPLRVTVTVTFQGVGDLAPREMARITWIVPYVKP